MKNLDKPLKQIISFITNAILALVCVIKNSSLESLFNLDEEFNIERLEIMLLIWNLIKFWGNLGGENYSIDDGRSLL